MKVSNFNVDNRRIANYESSTMDKVSHKKDDNVIKEKLLEEKDSIEVKRKQAHKQVEKVIDDARESEDRVYKIENENEKEKEAQKSAINDREQDNFFVAMMEEEKEAKAQKIEEREQEQKAADEKVEQKEIEEKEQKEQEIKEQELEKAEAKKEQRMEEMLEDFSKTTKKIIIMDGVKDGVYDRVQEILDEKNLLKEDIKGVVVDETT